MKHIKRFNESEEYLSKGNTLDDILSKIEKEFMNSPIKFIEILKRENNSIYIKYEIDWDMPETMEDWWDYEEVIEKHLNKLSDNLNIFEYNYDLTSIRIYPRKKKNN
jgi:hypothetical protein